MHTEKHIYIVTSDANVKISKTSDSPEFFFFLVLSMSCSTCRKNVYKLFFGDRFKHV